MKSYFFNVNIYKEPDTGKLFGKYSGIVNAESASDAWELAIDYTKKLLGGEHEYFLHFVAFNKL
ncbi:hypothetical protein ACVQK1_09290 [Edwardsiella tarda]